MDAILAAVQLAEVQAFLVAAGVMIIGAAAALHAMGLAKRAIKDM